MEFKSSWNERTDWHPVDGCNLGEQVGFCNDTCVVNTCNPHAQEAEAERWRTRGQPGLHNKTLKERTRGKKGVGGGKKQKEEEKEGKVRGLF